MGLAPSLHIAGHQFTGHGKEDFSHSADTELADTIRSLQLGIGRLDSSSDFITRFPLRRLLIGIHLISQPQRSRDLQPEIANGVSCLAAALAMVGCTHRAFVQHRTRATGIAVKDGMERAVGLVIATEDAMIDWTVSHRAFRRMSV